MVFHTVNQMLEWAKKHGFLDEGLGGGGHRRLRHERSGQVVFLPNTPSDWRGFRNTESDLRRICGVYDDKPKSGHYKRTKGSGFSIEVAQREQAQHQIGLAGVKRDLERVEQKIYEMADSGHIDKHEAKRVLAEKKHLQKILERMQRHVT